MKARASAQRFQEEALPVAVVAAERIPISTAEHVKQFAAQYAPDTGVGVVDLHGLRGFAGFALDLFDARPSRAAHRAAMPRHLPDLFSDLNQWMWKILLGQLIPESLLAVPRGPFRNASQLAEAAQVSVMTASRFLRQLRNEGLLDERQDALRLARVVDLLERWAAGSQHSSRENPVRWIIRQDLPALLSALRKYNENPLGGVRRAARRIVRRMGNVCGASIAPAPRGESPESARGSVRRRFKRDPAAATMEVGRILTPEALRETCKFGLQQVFP